MARPTGIDSSSRQAADAAVIVIVLLSVFAFAPLLYPGFVQTHSGLGAIYDALAAGAPFSGWMPTQGAPGDGPLATWLLVALKALVGPLAALKLLYAASFVLAGAGMFLLARRAWGALPALVAAAVYLFFPYRLAAVYVRGALAESLLLALAPLVIWALFCACAAPRWRALFGLAFLALAATLTHPGLAIALVVLAALWRAAAGDIAASSAPGARLAPYLALGGGLLAATLVLLPGGARVLANAPDGADHFLRLYQLFSPQWGFGESGAGWQDGLSFQLGLAPLALAFVALWLAVERRDAALRRTVLVLVALAAVLAALSLTLAAPLWRMTPLPALVAYPYQMLGLAALPLALLAGAAAHALGQHEANGAAGDPPRLAATAVLLALIVVSSYPYLAPRFVDAASLPDLSHPPLARLGDEAALLDLRVEGEARPGTNVTLVMFWQALRQPRADYTVFVHLLDAQGARQGQEDARPRNGEHPTTAWLRGEIVRDEIVLPIAASAPPGEYHLSVGMYELATMARLPVAGARADAITIGPLVVK